MCMVTFHLLFIFCPTAQSWACDRIRVVDFNRRLDLKYHSPPPLTPPCHGALHNTVVGEGKMEWVRCREEVMCGGGEGWMCVDV